MKGFPVLIIGLILMLVSSVVSMMLIIDAATNNEVLQAKAVVYDTGGNILKEYNGRITRMRRDNGRIRFSVDGRKIIIQGGIVIIEEE